MTHLKREKSRNSTTDAILNALDKKKYDGRKTIPSVQGGCGALEEVGFYNIERDIKLENLEEIDEETWIETLMGNFRRIIRGSTSRSIRSKDYERESTSSGDNLHNHLTKSSVARATRGQRRDVSLARLELYDRGNTYPIKIVDNFFASRWHRHSTST
ncbi:hypothetical protein RI054_15g73170 [Pseudoscourfieldia marina]